MGLFYGDELNDLVLRSERLTLRPWQPSDATAVHAILQDVSMHAYLRLPNPYTKADAESYVTGFAPAARRDATALESAVIDTVTGALVGSAALRLPGGPHGDPDIGYWIAPEAQGHGFAAEATRTLTEWGFTHGLTRIELRCDVRNLASARSALRSGFRFEGAARDYIHLADGAHDLAVFGRTMVDAGDPIAPVFAPLPTDGLSDAVLTLRVIRSADATGFAEQEFDDATVSTGFTGRRPDRADIDRMAARGGLDWLVGSTAPFAMVDVASGAYAGSLRLRQAGPPEVGGIGYAVHPAFRGRGYTTRALRLLVPWAFETAGFARLELGAKRSNVASQRAALAAGFEPDGVRAARLRNPDGSYADEVRFVLINPSVR